jgi:hypothetical protein
MGSKAKWVLNCKNCRVDSAYAEIPGDVESYFLPARPQLPEGFTFKCPNCGHENTYVSTELNYRGAWNG